MPSALAIAAHPDDIEFLMAGTLCLLGEAGWELHTFNLSTGNCGSATIPAARLRTVRAREARAAAKVLGAKWHAPIADDLEILYGERLLRRVAAVVRRARPTVVLTHALADYMEDHTHTARLAVTAAFARGMPNFRTQPVVAPWARAVTVYHAMPHGLRDGMGNAALAEAWVDTGSVRDRKRAALECHASQRAWLDASQGMDSYVAAMEAMAREVGRMSGRFGEAEGWTPHGHLGFCEEGADPLAEVLGARYWRGRGVARD
ncbi:MAG: PIG-L family deacetylase [Verrucomicrobiae bacterium]|nr:PIG-L family deacetylase [Verrucomicrobiae bacterium]